jgi:hypothetical protein
MTNEENNIAEEFLKDMSQSVLCSQLSVIALTVNTNCITVNNMLMDILSNMKDTTPENAKRIQERLEYLKARTKENIESMQRHL